MQQPKFITWPRVMQLPKFITGSLCITRCSWKFIHVSVYMIWSFFFLGVKRAPPRKSFSTWFHQRVVPPSHKLVWNPLLMIISPPITLSICMKFKANLVTRGATSALGHLIFGKGSITRLPHVYQLQTYKLGPGFFFANPKGLLGMQSLIFGNPQSPFGRGIMVRNLLTK